MSFAKSSFIILWIFAAKLTLAQTGSDTLLAKDNVMIPLPTVSVNFGISNAFTDVRLNSDGPSAFTQFGYQLTITQRVTKFMNASLNLYTGTIYGEQQIGLTNLNYRTTLFSQHANVEYNFYPLLKPNDEGRQLIRPYVGFGLGVLSFRSKGDLKDAKGRKYHYWSDGLIYAEDEESTTQSEATQLERDFQYETDLRDANLDGLRKYPQLAFSLPLNAGIRFQISKNVGLNMAFAYSLNFSDMLDNVSEDGAGDRKGTAGYDNHLFGSVGLSVFLGTTKPTAKLIEYKEKQLAEAAKAKAAENEKTPTENPSSEKADSLITESGNSENLGDEAEAEKPAPTSEEQLAEISAARRTISKLQQEITVRQTKINELGKEISSEKKLKKPQAEAVEILIDQQAITNQEIEALAAQLAQLKGNSTDRVEPSEQPKKEIEESESPKLKTKEDAIAILASIATELSETQAVLTEERTAIKSQESKLNQLGVVKAKIRLMEKMQAKNEVASPESITELTRTSAALTAEVEKLKSDAQLLSLIDESEISALNKRIQSVQTEIASNKANPSQDDGSAAERLPENEKNTAASEPVKGKVSEKSRSVEEIENTPPKETGGFMWADINGNGWISPDEVLHFIDLLFEGEAVRTVEDIQNLIDYYFDQE